MPIPECKDSEWAEKLQWKEQRSKEVAGGRRQIERVTCALQASDEGEDEGGEAKK